MKSNQEEFGEPIFCYTSKDAELDGVLFDLLRVNQDWEKGLFNYVTMNLLRRGYLDGDVVKVANLLDLLNQANQIVKKESKDFTQHNWLFSGSVELPDGSQQKVFICQNETEKFTVMLPEDY